MAATRLYPYCMRQIPKPSIGLPIACRSVGHYSLFPGWQNRPTLKNCMELFWGIRGQGRFLLDGREILLKAGQVLVLFPGRVHNLKAITHWEFRWVTFDGAMPQAMAEALGLREEPFVAGRCPEELFARLSYEIEDISPKGQLAASATAYEILTLAHARPQATEPSHVRYCIDLIRRHYGQHELNVTWLADKVGIHRTNLSKMFQEKLRVSPIEYLTLFRVGKALKLLQGTDWPVARIAQETGFSCPSYFTNVIRKRTGLSPAEIRSHRGQRRKPAR